MKEQSHPRRTGCADTVGVGAGGSAGDPGELELQSDQWPSAERAKGLPSMRAALAARACRRPALLVARRRLSQTPRPQRCVRHPASASASVAAAAAAAAVAAAAARPRGLQLAAACARTAAAAGAAAVPLALVCSPRWTVHCDGGQALLAAIRSGDRAAVARAVRSLCRQLDQEGFEQFEAGGGLQLLTAELKGAEPALKVDVLKVLRALVKRGMVPFVERSDVIGGAIVCAGASSPGSPRLEPPRH